MVFHTINYITRCALKTVLLTHKVIFCFFLHLLIVNSCSGQNRIYPVDFVDSLDTLQSSIVQFYREKALAELENYNYRTRAHWLKYLPSPGWNFIFNSPIISYNFSDVANAINAKHIRKATITAILQANQVQMNSAWYELVLQRETLISKINAYNSTLNLLELYQAKYEIVEMGFVKNEITPSDYLSAKLTLASFKNSLEKDFSTLVQLRNELLIKAKKGKTISLFADGLHTVHLKKP
jgi:hypothetical protein